MHTQFFTLRKSNNQFIQNTMDMEDKIQMEKLSQLWAQEVLRKSET